MTIITGSVETSSFTHTGMVRNHNEDAVLALPNAGLWAVADGMGGHERGEFASHCVIDHLYDLAIQFKGHELVDALPQAIAAANHQIYSEAIHAGEDTIIGTTVVILVMENDRYHCFWSGDSRCYLYREDRLLCVTRDHTYAESLQADPSSIQHENIPEAMAQALTHAIGIDETPTLDYISDYIYEGDRFLLCSDGLTKVYDDRILADRVCHTNIDQINLEFLSDALQAGAPDNISSILVGL